MTESTTHQPSRIQLDRARRLLALAQTGIHYATSAFDKERYEEIARIAHSQIADLVSMDVGEVAELFAFESGYANPKLDVRCAVFDETGRVLLVREASDGLWSLPGGWADVGLSPAENAAKEVREESGYTVRIERLLAIWDMNKHGHPPSVFHIWKLIFLGTIEKAGTSIGTETDAVEFFSIGDLPALSLGRVLPEQIQRLHGLYRSGDVDFN
ncbi:putative ADP-ribose pyrophosphatase YjhB (plasmid) [Paraburkholderia sp. PGU19]|uniref:NUDIX hydrolase n=1 Tax=Paraburkholderia sp. PGU19 TaxID=2735434 RepID=UPI0015DAB204|nr:NUDIX hydrolase [Paraburkholderia sp. PGU19]BCG05288.1 putative ADP-ribose pyrophosphatase YjhB [Paraburkholderia sp. PGU19]